jgi:hypothetical protein
VRIDLLISAVLLGFGEIFVRINRTIERSGAPHPLFEHLLPLEKGKGDRLS